MKPRAVVLGGALLATLAASWWSTLVEDEPESLVATRGERGARPDPASRPRPEADLLRIAREPWPAWGANIFRPLEDPALPAQAAAPASPAPSAPPLPFRYVGALEEGGRRAAILLEGGAMHIRRAGQRIGDDYRVERISATQIEFTHLPTMQRQVLVTSLHEQYR